MKRKAIVSAALAIALCAGMCVTAYAGNNLMAAMEERSRQAVTAAVNAGIIPPDISIYDCAYGKGPDGTTVVVQYRDKSGNWIDVTTRGAVKSHQSEDTPTQSVPAASANKPTAQQLEEYAAEVFRLVNAERRQAGLAEVIWDDDFADCARIRAGELQHRYSHYRPVEPTAGDYDWPKLSNGKPGYYNCPSVADEQGVDYTWVWENIVADRRTPEAAVKAWMDSAGHRDNILMESHTRCGVGVLYTEQKSPEGHNWYWVIWFDE